MRTGCVGHACDLRISIKTPTISLRGSCKNSSVHGRCVEDICGMRKIQWVGHINQRPLYLDQLRDQSDIVDWDLTA